MTFEPATLLVGANDAGKTTIIEAISMVLATGYDVWEHEPGAPDGRRQSPWDQVAHRNSGSDGGDDRVFVSVTFDELSALEQDSWRAVLDTGAPLRLGRMWGPDQSGGTLCVVLDRPQYRQLVEDAGLGAEDHPLAQPGEKEDYLRHPSTIEDEVWCNFIWLNDMTLTFGTQLLGLVPELDVNAIRIPGPEAAIPDPAIVLRPLVSSIVARSASLPGATDADDPWDQPDDLGPQLGQLGEAASHAVEAVSKALDKAVARVRGDGAQADVRRLQRHRSDILRKVIDEVVGPLEVSLDGEVIGRAGAGARRAALLAGLELYRDPDLWTPDERYEGVPFTDRGFEHVPALEHLQGWLIELMAA